MATEPPKAASIPPPPGLTLGELAREIHGEVSVHGDAGVRLLGVHHDSRRVGPSDLFVVRKGETSDGARFLADAEARGAVAVCAVRGEIDPAATKLPILWVQDARIALAQAAAAVYGHPSFALDVVGVTGTNGKTTTAEWLGHTLREAGMDAAVAGNVGRPLASLPGEVDPAATIVCECSSFQLEDSRAFAPEVAVLLNVTPDHLDRHGTLAAYAEAKLRIFSNQTAEDTAIVDADDPVVG